MKLLFPCNIHEIKIKGFKIIREEVLQYIYQEKKKDPEGVEKSNAGGWQSTSKYASFENILIDTARKEIAQYFNSKRIFREGVGVEITNLWININPKNASNRDHIHPASHLAGVWWIKVPPDSGKLYFNCPNWFEQFHEMCSYSDEFKEFSSTYPDYYLNPYEGGIIIFPSSLFHRVEESKSNKDRISVSFNINLYPPD